MKSYDELLRSIYPDRPQYALVHKPPTRAQRVRWWLSDALDWLRLESLADWVALRRARLAAARVAGGLGGGSMIAIETRCATCKHWYPFELRAGEPRRVRLGLCEKASNVGQMDDDSGRTEDSVIAMAEDASHYRRNFRTAAEFGCVLYESGGPQAWRGLEE